MKKKVYLCHQYGSYDLRETSACEECAVGNELKQLKTLLL